MGKFYKIIEDLENNDADNLELLKDVSKRVDYTNNIKTKEYKLLLEELYSYQGLVDGSIFINGLLFIYILDKNKIPCPTLSIKEGKYIGFSWEKNDNYAEIKITQEDFYSYFYDIKNQIKKETNINLNKFPKKLKKIIEKGFKNGK